MAAALGCDGGVQLAGMVRSSEGTPISGATVRLERRGSSRHFENQTSAGGCFDSGGVVAPGNYRYTLRVVAPGYAPAEGEIPTLQQNFRLVILETADSKKKSSVVRVDTDPCGRSLPAPAEPKASPSTTAPSK
jgi:hypothetical protein